MRAYYSRHTSAIQVADADLKALWDEERIAVHYPDPGGKLGSKDSRSTEPTDYSGQGRVAVPFREFCTLRIIASCSKA